MYAHNVQNNKDGSIHMVNNILFISLNVQYVLTRKGRRIPNVCLATTLCSLNITGTYQITLIIAIQIWDNIQDSEGYLVWMQIINAYSINWRQRQYKKGSFDNHE